MTTLYLCTECDQLKPLTEMLGMPDEETGEMTCYECVAIYVDESIEAYEEEGFGELDFNAESFAY